MTDDNHLTDDDIQYDQVLDQDLDLYNFDIDIHTAGFIDSLDEEDGLEIEHQVYESIDEYLHDEMPRYSKPLFLEEMIFCIVEPLFEHFYDAGFCDEDDYDEIYEFVRVRAEVVVETVLRIPPRSHPDARILAISTQTDKITAQIAALRSIPQPEQRTPAWYEFRHNLITASNIGKIFSTESQFNSLIYEKCQPPMSSITSAFSSVSITSPLHWGNKYEPVSVLVYEHMFKTRVGEFGCIRHPQYTCIGASPDGINVDLANPDRYGRMLEIKNIVNREITGIPLEMYWIQMQVQMETCGLDECDFLETRFKEYADSAEFYADTFSQYKGVILYFIDKVTTASSKPFYVYMDLAVLHSNNTGITEKEAVNAWVAIQRKKHIRTHVLFEPLFWRLAEMSCVLVERNRLWFQSVLPKIQATWRIIEKERVEGYAHRMAKKRANSLTDNPPTNPKIGTNGGRVCLIKLE